MTSPEPTAHLGVVGEPNIHGIQEEPRSPDTPRSTPSLETRKPAVDAKEEPPRMSTRASPPVVPLPPPLASQAPKGESIIIRVRARLLNQYRR